MFPNIQNATFVDRPAESQCGPRGRPLSGPLHIPAPFPQLPFPSPSPPSRQKRGSGGLPASLCGPDKGSVGSWPQVLHVSFSCFPEFSLVLDLRGRLRPGREGWGVYVRNLRRMKVVYWVNVSESWWWCSGQRHGVGASA